MSNMKFTAVVALLLSGTVAWAADGQTAQDKPSFFASQSTMITARVEAINHETRDVTLRGPQGNQVSFTVSQEARNLDQVSVGDIVTAEYVKSISIDVLANDGVGAGAGGVTAVARAEKGAMPGMAAMDAQVVTATVEEINLEANTFKLKGPDGDIQQYVARNPENLKKAEVGDRVVFTTTQAVGISVEAGQ